MIYFLLRAVRFKVQALMHITLHDVLRILLPAGFGRRYGERGFIVIYCSYLLLSIFIINGFAILALDFFRRECYGAAQQLHALKDIFGSGWLKLLEVILDDFSHPIKIRCKLSRLFTYRADGTAVLELSLCHEGTGREFLTLVDYRILVRLYHFPVCVRVVSPCYQSRDVATYLASCVNHVVRSIEFENLTVHLPDCIINECKDTAFFANLQSRF